MYCSDGAQRDGLKWRCSTHKVSFLILGSAQGDASGRLRTEDLLDTARVEVERGIVERVGLQGSSGRGAANGSRAARVGHGERRAGCFHCERLAGCHRAAVVGVARGG